MTNRQLDWYIDSTKLLWNWISPQDIENILIKIYMSDRLFFIGNGGSNAVAIHMAEDFSKVGGIPSFAPTCSSFLTCLANDYSFHDAFRMWLIHTGFNGDKDLLFAISSSGNSGNITNAARLVGPENVITFSGFSEDNKLKQLGYINIHLPINDYGVVECLHQMILHSILDEIVTRRKHKKWPPIPS
jgi:D-sedoheptulose 7-phosphate isomerase